VWGVNVKNEDLRVNALLHCTPAVRVLNVVMIYLWMRVSATQCVSTVLLNSLAVKISLEAQ